MVKNELYRTESGTLRPRPTDRLEEMPVGLLFRSVGYRGVPLPGVPFNDDWGVILNEKGRIVDPKSGDPVPGMYTSGWIKRGPSGVVGTNKADSVETVNCLLEDVAAGRMITPTNPSVAAAEELVRARQPAVFTFDDWKRIDALELERGAKMGRPRVKFTSRREMEAALGRY
jgi:ferredoxin--NADP+ reductase